MAHEYGELETVVRLAYVCLHLTSKSADVPLAAPPPSPPSPCDAIVVLGRGMTKEESPILVSL